MWDGKFKDQDLQNIDEMYFAANLKYRERLQQLYLDDMKKLRHLIPTGRLFIETFDECQDRFTQVKLKKDYRFVTHPNRERQQQLFMMNEIVNKVYINMEERQNRGIDQRATKASFEKILGFNNQDPRLLAENNLGDGGRKDMYDN